MSVEKSTGTVKVSRKVLIDQNTQERDWMEPLKQENNKPFDPVLLSKLLYVYR